MQKVGATIDLVLRAVAVGMPTASIVLGIMNVADLETQVTLLGIGLFTLALASLRKAE
jgi:hypothetical protein